MKYNKRKDIDNWAARQEKGQWHLEVKLAVFWGVFMYLAMSLTQFSHKSFIEIYLSQHSAFSLFYWLNAGLALSAARWWWDKRSFFKKEAKRSNRV